MVGFLYERSHKRGLSDFGDLASGRRISPFSSGSPCSPPSACPASTASSASSCRCPARFSGPAAVLALAGALGVTLAAAYALPAFQAVFWAPAGPGSVSDKVTDLNLRERAVLWTLCGLMLWIGLAPKPWLAFFEPALRGLIR